jgi:nucleotide-binding universal stress UspA family protein
MISRILVPTDGSDVAWKSVEYAVDLAKQTGATVAFLSVIDKGFIVAQSVPDLVTPTHLIEPIEDYLRQAAEAYLEKAEKLCRENRVDSEKVITSGHPVEEIMKEAEKRKIDLVVMGSHGKSALKAALLGSVTFGVVHKDAKIPVLIVRR